VLAVRKATRRKAFVTASFLPSSTTRAMKATSVAAAAAAAGLPPLRIELVSARPHFVEAAAAAVLADEYVYYKIL